MRQSHKTMGWFFSFPAILGLFLFVGLPFLLAVGMSFTSYRLGSPIPWQWIGLEQYSRIFSDESFISALKNNALYALFIVPIQTVLALSLAILLNKKLIGATATRAAFFAPVVFPMSLVAVIWILFFAPTDTGLINFLLSKLSFGLWEPVDFLRSPWHAFSAIVITSIWQGLGFQMVILLAGLQGIPGYLYEAAKLDGANNWQQFVHITLPQMKTTLTFVALITTILAFRMFDQVRIMTQGGPADATTTVIVEAVQASFDKQKIAEAAAMTVVFFVVVLIISLVQNLVTNRRQT